MIPLIKMIACDSRGETYLQNIMQSAMSHPRHDKRLEMVHLLGDLRDPRALGTLSVLLSEDDLYMIAEAIEAARKD